MAQFSPNCGLNRNTVTPFTLGFITSAHIIYFPPWFERVLMIADHSGVTIYFTAFQKTPGLNNKNFLTVWSEQKSTSGQSIQQMHMSDLTNGKKQKNSKERGVSLPFHSFRLQYCSDAGGKTAAGNKAAEK